MKDKKSILLVEDEASLSMIIKDALEEEDFQVITAGNGLQGIDRFYKYAPDLIIADVMMPEIDGFEMIRRIRKENKEVPVLFLSARSSTDDIVFGFELGANDYVRKPFSLRELVVRAKALLIKYKQEEGRTEFYEIGLYTFYPKVQTLLIAGESDKLSYKETEKGARTADRGATAETAEDDRAARYGVGVHRGDEIIVVAGLIRGPAQTVLFQVVGAGNGFGTLARLVQGRQQHAGQNRDDDDDDQKLDQREVPDFPVHGEYLSVIG